MADTKKVVPLTEEQLEKKGAELQQLEDKLNADKQTFEQEKADFEKIKSEKEAELEKKESDLDELEQTLLSSEGATVVDAEPEPGLEFKLEKEKYKFKDSSPKKLRVGGKNLSQEEIVKDKDILQKLVKGPHIEKIK